MSNPIYQPWVKPFVSGSGMCYPSTDSQKFMLKGGKSKSKTKKIKTKEINLL